MKEQANANKFIVNYILFNEDLSWYYMQSIVKVTKRQNLNLNLK